MASRIAFNGNESGSGYPAANEIMSTLVAMTVPIRLIADSRNRRPVGERNLSKLVMT